MKTVVITISRGSIAYNLLNNDFYRILREQYKIIILTSAYNDERFLNEFSHPNTTFLPFDESGLSFLERLVFFFHKHLIYNSTVNQKSRWGIIGDPRSKRPWYLGHILRKVIFVPLSKLRFLRDLLRVLDYRFLQVSEVSKFRDLLTQHKADLVISTFVNGNSEAALIKAAKKEGIKSIGFPKSWDNLSKHGLRAKPDLLVVWNDFMREQAVDFDNYSNDEIEVVGVPQFDNYIDTSILMSREEFCNLYKLDSSKKIILFGSEGKLFPTDTAIADILSDSIKRWDAQLLIRPHYGYKNDEVKFKDSLKKMDVQVDLVNNPSSNLRDAWDYSEEFASRFRNCLHHADVLINTASTLSIDAIAFDTPVINVAFDGRNKLPYKKSIARWYETHYYQRVLSYQATTVVHSDLELTEAIDTYFVDPTHRSENREKFRNDLTFALDGKAGERFANIVCSVFSKHV